jgi:hypothetical protein
MRNDMSKVLVESPRLGRALARAFEGTRRRFRDRLDRDGESAPQRMGMRQDTDNRKQFGEHLSPLLRYLQGQVDRPWSKVYSDLCSRLDRRNLVQAHAFVHIDDYVKRATVWHDGRVFVRTRWGLESLAECGCKLYVHPLTGILLRNRAAAVARRRWKEARASVQAESGPDRRIGLPGMSIDRQWHRVRGIWYEVALCLLDEGAHAAPAYDVVLGHLVNRDSRKVLAATYGYIDAYAWSKRQLPGKTLRKHGLESQVE